jgi:hypothetical protein
MPGPIDGLWYVLSLVDVRTGVLGLTPAARSRSVAALQALINLERVEPYGDDGVRKFFRRGGPLEWRQDPEVVGMGNVSPVYAVSDIPAHAMIARAERLREIPTVEDLAAAVRAEGEPS